MAPLPDLVRLSKLDTTFPSGQECTQHVKYTTQSSTDRRKVRKNEKWKKDKPLGRGGFGTVWLERCIAGDSNGRLRAVKNIPKLDAGDYNRELEAIALFSHDKVELLLLQSLVFTNTNV